MSLSFTRAVEAVPGQPITSDHMASLSRALNDRLLSGVGDIAWRTVMWWLNLFRLVRAPDGTFFPAMAEFFNLYQHLDPEHAEGIQWPTSEAGDPEGANLANPLMQFVFGNETTDTEHGRLSDFVETPLTMAGHWELAKSQRGAYDPNTGALASPAFTKAESIYAFAFPTFNAHHKSYGAFFPSPVELLADCSDGDSTSEYYNVPSFEIKFTRLRSDVSAAGLHGTLSGDVLTYPGTCPCESALHDANHVAWIAEYPFSYYVWVAPSAGSCDFALDVLPVADWITGPYTGNPHIFRPDGGQIKRIINAYVQDFRGTPDQRANHDLIGRASEQSRESDTYRIKDIAADNEKFFTSQYPLAPAIGVEVGENVNAIYPRATITSSMRSREAISFDSGSGSHAVASGFVACGFFASALGLTKECGIEVLNNGVTVQTLRLVPVEGAAEALFYSVSNPPNGLLTLRTSGEVQLEPGGQIVVEVAEVLEYKPQFHDAYLCARLMSTRGSWDTTFPVDGRGIDVDDAARYVSRLHTYGTVHSEHGALSTRMPEQAVSDNGVYDVARRLSRDMVRMWRREHFVSYEVADGKTILRMRRFAFSMHNSRADAFHGIAPSLDPMTDLDTGAQYIVRGTGDAKVYHGGTALLPDAVFTATGPDFTAVGDGEVYEYDGIRQEASRNNWSNRWCLFLDTRVYHPSTTSIWKPEAYADFFPLVNRCLFYAAHMTDAEFFRHVSFTHGYQLNGDYLPEILPQSIQADLIAAEAPTGYRYSRGSNQGGGDPSSDFCKSCQIYVAPYEIESCIVDSEWDGDQIVKLTLDRRMDSHPDAPAAVDADPSTWSAGDKSDLAAETYRTDDNALREYALHIHDDTSCSQKEGDAGSGSSVFGLTDNPFGSCYPTICAVRLMPEPWIDANDKADALDTRRTVPSMLQAEILIRAGCEGFVDESTTLDLQCDGTDSKLFDYSFENLCYDAFAGRWCGAFTTAERPDNPQGFGPCVNTNTRSEVYNRLAKCVNKLTKARVDMNLTFNGTSTIYGSSHPLENLQPPDASCSLTSLTAAYSEPCRWLGAAYSSTNPSGPETAIAASKSMYIGGCPFTLETSQTDWSYSIEVPSPLVDAIPTAIAELVTLGQAGCMARREVTVTDFRREACDAGVAETCGGSAIWGNYRWVDHGSTTTDCVFITSGTLTADDPPEQSIYFGTVPGPTNCQLSTGTTAALIIASGTEFFVEVPVVEYAR